MIYAAFRFNLPRISLFMPHAHLIPADASISRLVRNWFTAVYA
jgi:hypothetical protein